MAAKSIHIFENGGALVAFPAELPVKGRGADHIVLHNSTDFTLLWMVPAGVFDEDVDHEEVIAPGGKSERQKVKARKARAVPYRVQATFRVGRKTRRRYAQAKSDPVIIIDL